MHRILPLQEVKTQGCKAQHWGLSIISAVCENHRPMWPFSRHFVPRNQYAKQWSSGFLSVMIHVCNIHSWWWPQNGHIGLWLLSRDYSILDWWSWCMDQDCVVSKPWYMMMWDHGNLGTSITAEYRWGTVTWHMGSTHHVLPQNCQKWGKYHVTKSVSANCGPNMHISSWFSHKPI